MVVGNTGVTYTYDMNSRLWKVTYSGQPQITHEYDWVGNRLVPGSAQYNAADQLTSGFGHTYNYDGRGNLTSSVGANGKTYTYTPANLLESVTHDEVQGSPVSPMTWDWGTNSKLEYRNSKQAQMTETAIAKRLVDRSAHVPSVDRDLFRASYFGFRVSHPGGYYHFDALGSTRLLTDGSGAVTDEYSYDAWGNVSHDTGSTAQPYQFVGQLGYYTHVQDENLDLLQLGVRFYDSESGRFTQRDPIKDGLNWYAYVYGEPTQYVDPTGLWGTIEFIRHYYFGFGRPIDLANVGLLSEYQMAMSDRVARFREQTIGRLKSAARKKCQEVGGKVTLALSHQDNSGEHVRNGNESNPLDPLYSIGNHVFRRSSACRAVADCCTRTLTYECDCRYELVDRFSDPLSFREGYGRSVEIGWPYDITAFWSVKLCGGDGF